MRLAARLTLTFSLAGLVLFGGFGAWMVQREAAQLDAAARSELLVLGRALQVSFENALRDGQIEDIRETLTRLQPVAPEVDILIVDTSGRYISASAGAQAPSTLTETLIRRALEQGGAHVERWPGAPIDRLAFACPLREDDGRRQGAILVSKPLDDLQADVQETTRSIMLLTLLFIAVSTLLARQLASTVLVTPLRRLLAAMGRVRDGELDISVGIERTDELGEVAAAFNEMTADLAHARRDLMQEAEARRGLQRALQHADKLIAVGQIAATLAHEVASPLQALIGRAEAITEEPSAAEEVERHARIIVDQGGRISGIIERLLDYARRHPRSVQQIAVPGVVERVAALLELEARRQGVSLRRTVAEGLPPLTCDVEALEQLVFNLLRNALVACSAGDAIEVDVSTATLQRDPSLPSQDCIAIEVRDTGTGIATEVLPRIFEPFYTTRSEAGGTGLGLAVVQRVVDAHRGTIDVTSTPNEGTTFRVYLPLDAPMEAP